MQSVADLIDFIESQEIRMDDEPQPIRLDWIEEVERWESMTEDDYVSRIETDGYLIGTVLA